MISGLKFGEAKLSEIKAALKQSQGQGITIEDSYDLGISTYTDIVEINEGRPNSVNGKPNYVLVDEDIATLGDRGLRLLYGDYLPGESAQKNSGDVIFRNLDIIG